MIQFEFPLNRLENVPLAETASFSAAIAKVERVTNSVIIVGIFYSTEYIGNVPLKREIYPYQLDEAFTALLVANNGDTAMTADSYLTTLPEFAGGVVL